MEAHSSMTQEEYMALWEEHGIDSSTLSRKKGSKPSPRRKVKNLSYKTLEEIKADLSNCQRCGLCEARDKIVFGEGNKKTKIMFIGEGPGANEDKTGLPFVGRAGDLLNKIIEAMSLNRDQVYIANIVKCRPPSNRVPRPEEIEKCLPFLKAQIDIINPDIIVALGLTASATLSGEDCTMGELRGKFHPLLWNNNISVMATYHPAYLLRNPAAKKVVWEDMKLVLKKTGTPKK